MHKILNKKVQLLGKCALCKNEESLCKCGDIQSIEKGEISKGLKPTKPKGTQLFTKQPMSLGHRVTQTVGLTKKTKKSENWINLKTANIQGERIKNVGGAGYTPSEKKSVVVPNKGSGGLSKSIVRMKKGGPGSGRKASSGSSVGQLPVSGKDYSHLLPASQVKAGSRLLAGHDSNTGKTYSYLVNNGKLAGVHIGETANDPKSKVQYKTLRTSLAGKHDAGVSRALYNAGLHHATSQSK
jgi:hypothetical protein